MADRTEWSRAGVRTGVDWVDSLEVSVNTPQQSASRQPSLFDILSTFLQIFGCHGTVLATAADCPQFGPEPSNSLISSPVPDTL